MNTPNALPLLSLEGVEKIFSRPGRSDVVALRDINLAIQEGEFLSIVGASGSGKSTLLRIIDGLVPASGGCVRVNGQQVVRPGADRAVVFQNDSLLPWRSVLDNVAYGLRLAGNSKSKSREIARHFVTMAGLAGFESHYPHQLSGGMRQRVNVARALAVNPRILLMDEPFAALDAQTREIMQSELLEIWQRSGTTVLLITHQIDEAVYLSDRVVIFSARPGTVREEVRIDLPRPRDLEVKRSPEFGRMVEYIWHQIEDDVRKAVSSNG